MSACDYELTRRYLRQRYQESRAARMAASAAAGAASGLKRPGLADRLALRFGELLVAYGLKLKARYWAAADRPRHFFILDLGAD